MKEAAVADSPRETLALARTAAGAVRSLNHATFGSGGLAQPADACELIGELSLAAAGLPQLQAQQQLATVHGAPEEGESS